MLDRLVVAHPERARRLSAVIFAPVPTADAPETNDRPDVEFLPEDVSIDPKRWANIGDAIVKLVARYHGISMRELGAARRTFKICRARQVGYYLCKLYTHQSFVQIGDLFGGRDHTTVMHGIKVISDLIAKRDAGVLAEVAALSELLLAAHPWLVEVAG